MFAKIFEANPRNGLSKCAVCHFSGLLVADFPKRECENTEFLKSPHVTWKDDNPLTHSVTD